MYSDAFCKVYNEFGWNYFPEAFAEQLLMWIEKHQIEVKTSMDLACGTGVLCEALYKKGIQAEGMDFSEGMIHIARESNPNIAYEVADMITFRPDRKFDLVTCTGDALNHIIDLQNVEKIFENVYAYLKPDGYFIFDVLNEKEVPMAEPFDLDFSETVKAQFLITQDQEGMIRLQTTVYENGDFQFQEVITETIHDIDKICTLLKKCGFKVEKCAHQLLEDAGNEATTWFVIAKKPKKKAVLFDLDGTLLPMDQDAFIKEYFGLLAKRLTNRGYEPKGLIDTVVKGTMAMIKNDGSVRNEELFWKVFTDTYGEDAIKDKGYIDDFYREEFALAKVHCGFHSGAKEVVELVKEKGLMPILATNPLFPPVATENRMSWAGLSPKDFVLYTTYENSCHCKPNPQYYMEILEKLGLEPEECLMVGNDVAEDMIARTLGMDVFLLTDCLLNRKGEDISAYAHGSFEELKEVLCAI